ncbi:MAG: 50S ribosomal protein L18 [Patescibacteria group bacterium]|nr:50S ribosomal protein L18 [Patescibacteria group bacterium]
MRKLKDKKLKRKKRKIRIRSKIFGTAKKPRLNVYKSNKHIYAQLIDDKKNKTIVSVSDMNTDKAKISKEKKEKEENSGQKAAFLVGQKIGQKALKKNIKNVVFDRGGFKYHGQVKSLAEGARKAGLIF